MFREIEKKVEQLVDKYRNKIVKNTSDIYFYSAIPTKKLNNAIKAYAQVLRHSDVFALYDDTVFGKADNGFIIAKKGIWYYNFLDKPRYFLYTQLTSVCTNLDEKKLVLDYDNNRIEEMQNYFDKESSNLKSADDTYEYIKAVSRNIQNTLEYCQEEMEDVLEEKKYLPGINNTHMGLFLLEIIQFISKLRAESEANDEINKEEASSRTENINTDTSGSRETKITSENEKSNRLIYTNAANATHLENDAQFQKYHNQNGGHGYAAEDANALNDILRGRKVEKTGGANTLDGPDRIVDGIKIQTKYWATAEETLNAALDNQGRFRYEGQMLEVPKDQYKKVRILVQKKIDNGELVGKDGNPLNVSKAEEIVKEGSITYAQAKNIAKAGNIDSITFDIKNQVITSGCIMGASVVLSTAINIWHGKKDFSEAAQEALIESFQAGKSSMFVGVLSAQALRTKTAASGTIIVRPAVNWMYKTKFGKVAIEKIAEASLGKAVYGASAVNNVSKLLRSNVITAGITVAVVTAPGFYRSLFAKNQSWTQFFKDLSVTLSGIAGGAGGWFAGAWAGAAAGSIIPGVGNAVGGMVGGVIGALLGGAGASTGAKTISDEIADDDSVAVWKDIRGALEELATDYLLTEEELNKHLLPQIQHIATKEWLRTIYQQAENSSVMRRGIVYSTFTQFCDGLLEDRKKLQITNEALEEQGTIFIDKATDALIEVSDSKKNSDSTIQMNKIEIQMNEIEIEMNEIGIFGRAD